MGQVVLLMVAPAAAFGAGGLVRRSGSPRARAAIAFAVVALVNLEALRAPLGYESFSHIPHIYGVLAREPHAVVAEMPFFDPGMFYGNATYMLNSTRHWHPMLNGYSGFRPRSYDGTFAALQSSPDDALAVLKARGVTHIVVHNDRYDEAALEAVLHLKSLELVAGEEDIEIFRLR
jgi:hypothetical protein